jgi:beta-mannosidase
MQVISLDSDQWALSCPSSPDFTVPAKVPGNLQRDLWQAGKLPDPYIKQNTEAYQGLEEKTWVYQRRFAVPDFKNHLAWYLIFEGVDYEARIVINGRVLGTHEGQMGQIVFEVSEFLREENELEVTLLPIHKAPHPSRAWIDPFAVSRNDGRWLVKSLMSFGWDFAPYLVPLGIWKPVSLIGTAGAYLHSPRTDLAFNQTLSEVDITFLIEVESKIETPAALRINLYDPQKQPVLKIEKNVTLPPGPGILSINGRLKNPQLWWPNGMGPAPLYRAGVELLIDGVSGGGIEYPVGFRTLAMTRSASDECEKIPIPAGPRKWETSFVVNGVPMYYRGSNLVPPDIFFGNIDDERLKDLIRLTREANINLLRVWGGGILMPEAFYRYADEAGILVWQEFPLGCTDHAGNEHYVKVLEHNARSMIGKIRHHPCLALWCGGNELFQDHSGMAPQDKILRMLAALCYNLDPDRPFLPTTPYPGAVHGPYTFDGAGAGRYGELYDQVQWCNALKPAAYNECGIASPGHADTMRAVLPAAELWPPKRGTAWEFHKAFGVWGEGRPWLIPELIEEYFGPLDNVEDLAYAGQFLQAIGLQYMVEELRRRWPEVPGTMTWCLNEPWTALANCSIVAYPLKPKAAYFALQSAYRPCDCSARLDHFVLLPGETSTVEIFLINDTLNAMPAGNLTLEIKSFLTHAVLAKQIIPSPTIEGNQRIPLTNISFQVPNTPSDVLTLRLSWEYENQQIQKQYWFGIGKDSQKPRRSPNQCFRPLLNRCPE